jgi:hypothetical protein
LAAFDSRHSLPGGKRRFGGRDGGIDIWSVRLRDLGDDRATISRIEIGGIAARTRFDPSAIDEIAGDALGRLGIM